MGSVRGIRVEIPTCPECGLAVRIVLDEYEIACQRYVHTDGTRCVIKNSRVKQLLEEESKRENRRSETENARHTETLDRVSVQPENAQ